MSGKTPPSRILAIKLADMGDLLLITPALRALREAYPDAMLDVLVTQRSAAVFNHLPLFDNLLTFDLFGYRRQSQRPVESHAGPHSIFFLLRLFGLRQLVAPLRFSRQLRARRYDTVILFHHLTLPGGAIKHAAMTFSTGARRRIGLDNGRGWFLTQRVPDPGFGFKHELDFALDLAAAAGAPAVSRQVEIGMTAADQAWAAEMVPPDERPTVALHTGSGGYSPARLWGLEHFAEVGRRTSSTARLVIVGTPADGTEKLASQLEEAIDLGGQTTVTQLAAVLARCDLLVGADSGVLHVASAVGTPTVALFGPTNHRAWSPVLPPPQCSRALAGGGRTTVPVSYFEGSRATIYIH